MSKQINERLAELERKKLPKYDIVKFFNNLSAQHNAEERKKLDPRTKIVNIVTVGADGKRIYEP